MKVKISAHFLVLHVIKVLLYVLLTFFVTLDVPEFMDVAVKWQVMLVP